MSDWPMNVLIGTSGLILGATMGLYLARRWTQRLLREAVLSKDRLYQLEERWKLREQEQLASLATHLELFQQVLLWRKLARPLLHDLATPLTALQANLDALPQTLSKTARQHLASKLERIAAHMQNLVQETRSIAEGHQPARIFPLEEEVTNVITVLQSELQRANVRLIRPKKFRERLCGSPLLFERVLLNIMLNAVEAMKDQPEGVPRRLILREKKTARHTIIEVQDSGVGLTRYTSDQASTLGFSTKPGHQGLGLAFVQDTIQQDFGGEVVLQNNRSGVGVLCQLRFSHKAPMQPSLAQKKAQWDA